MNLAEWLALIGCVAIGFCVIFIMLALGVRPRFKSPLHFWDGLQQNWQRQKQEQQQQHWQQQRQQWQQEQQRHQRRQEQQQYQAHRHELPLAERWFLILEVTHGATREEIERAYKIKISQYHPDKVAQLGIEIRELAEAKSKEINAAYDYAMRYL
ncbi:MAG TPA: J domain-containing protein [Burkholderiaceae bacterium]